MLLYHPNSYHLVILLIVDLLYLILLSTKVQRNGSISAEHGIGFMKAPYLAHTKSPILIDTMLRIKTLFDPKGILNPYKVFPTDKERVVGEGVRRRIGSVAEGCGCGDWSNGENK